MIYAKIVDGAIVSRETKYAPTSKNASDGGPAWRPLEELPKPQYDEHTQTLERVETIETARVLITWVAQEWDLATAKSARIDAINAEAGNKIVAVMPEYKQRNALALGLEMATTYGADPASWPSAEQAVYAAASAKWAFIKSIRDASNTAVAAVNSATSNAEVRAVSVVWPNA